MDLDNLTYNLNCNAADNLVQNIRSMIYSREILPGYEFPNEGVFCKQLGISRSTLREAFKVLESTGFIKRVKGHGTVVQDVAGIMAAAPLKETMRLAEMDDLLEFREMIETELVRYAAIRATDKEIAVLENLLKGMKENINDIARFSINDANFHIELAKASKNPLMIAVMRNMQNLITKAVFSAFQIETEDNTKEALAIHARILDAIKARNPEVASALMRQHIKSISRRISNTKDADKA